MDSVECRLRILSFTLQHWICTIWLISSAGSITCFRSCHVSIWKNKETCFTNLGLLSPSYLSRRRRPYCCILEVTVLVVCKRIGDKAVEVEKLQRQSQGMSWRRHSDLRQREVRPCEKHGDCWFGTHCDLFSKKLIKDTADTWHDMEHEIDLTDEF